MGAIRTEYRIRSDRPRTAPRPGRAFRFSDRLPIGHRAVVMGILNVTPDSFSDGGRFLDLDAAVAHARGMEAEGADLIDVGGESTRPGAREVSAAIEQRRVVPVVEAIRRSLGIPISIDTTKSSVAAAALAAGADIVNDVSAARDDSRMLRVVAEAGAGLILMHRRGTPRTMQRRPVYRDVVAEVARFLEGRARLARSSGIPKGSIAVDPGIGFGKTLAHNLTLLHGVRAIARLGYPVVIGVSRKSFLGTLLGLAVDQRVEASVAAAVVAHAGGARIFRVHDVAATVRALKVSDAIRGAR